MNVLLYSEEKKVRVCEIAGEIDEVKGLVMRKSLLFYDFLFRDCWLCGLFIRLLLVAIDT